MQILSLHSQEEYHLQRQGHYINGSWASAGVENGDEFHTLLTLLTIDKQFCVGDFWAS
jgi:hypothetical protein